MQTPARKMGLPRKVRSAKERHQKDIASTPVNTKECYSPPCFEEGSPIANSPSPVPFLCSQEGPQGENVVVWDYYSPKSSKPVPRYHLHSRQQNRLAPSKISTTMRLHERRKPLRHVNVKGDTLKNLKEELCALNNRVQSMARTETSKFPTQSTSTKESDMFSESDIDYSTLIDKQNETLTKGIVPKSKPPPENIESDDSMNEYLIRASQMIEEKHKGVQKDRRTDQNMSDTNCENVLSSTFKMETSINDSFDNLLSNINDSCIDIKTSAPLKIVNQANDKNGRSSSSIPLNNNAESKISIIDTSWDNISNFSSLLTDSIFNDSKNKLMRHKSMPTTENVPSVKQSNSFNRHNSLPVSEKSENNTGWSCTQEEIKKKREAAREKLLSKKQTISSLGTVKETEPIKSFNRVKNSTVKKSHSDNIKVTFSSQEDCSKKSHSSDRVSKSNLQNVVGEQKQFKSNNLVENNKLNIHNEIERKRLEALKKLQKKNMLKPLR